MRKLDENKTLPYVEDFDRNSMYEDITDSHYFCPNVLPDEIKEDGITANPSIEEWVSDMITTPTSRETLDRIAHALSTDAVVLQYVKLPGKDSSYIDIVNAINEIAANLGVYATKLLITRFGAWVEDETVGNLANLLATRIVDLVLGGPLSTKNPYGRTVIETSYESIAADMKDPVNTNNDILRYMKLKGTDDEEG